MAIIVYPRPGQTISAGSWAALLSETHVDFVPDGLTVPASSVDLNLEVAAGRGHVSGYRVTVDAAVTLALTDSATNHIYLALTRDGLGNVSGAELVANTTGVAPADSLKLAEAVCAGGAVTGTTDRRVLRPSDAVDRAGDTMTGDLTISKAGPAVYLTDTGETSPNGRFRLRSSGNVVEVARDNGDGTWTVVGALTRTGSLRLPNLAADPSGGAAGDVAMVNGKLRTHNGTAWGDAGVSEARVRTLALIF